MALQAFRRNNQERECNACILAPRPSQRRDSREAACPAQVNYLGYTLQEHGGLGTTPKNT